MLALMQEVSVLKWSKAQESRCCQRANYAPHEYILRNVGQRKRRQTPGHVLGWPAGTAAALDLDLGCVKDSRQSLGLICSVDHAAVAALR
jgi:hypothetical protein